MACNGICSDVKARRITVKFGTLYKENFRCTVCCKYIPFNFATKKSTGTYCNCCKVKVRTRSLCNYKNKVTSISFNKKIKAEVVSFQTETSDLTRNRGVYIVK